MTKSLPAEEIKSPKSVGKCMIYLILLGTVSFTSISLDTVNGL